METRPRLGRSGGSTVNVCVYTVRPPKMLVWNHPEHRHSSGTPHSTFIRGSVKDAHILHVFPISQNVSFLCLFLYFMECSFFQGSVLGGGGQGAWEEPGGANGGLAAASALSRPTEIRESRCPALRPARLRLPPAAVLGLV